MLAGSGLLHVRPSSVERKRYRLSKTTTPKGRLAGRGSIKRSALRAATCSLLWSRKHRKLFTTRSPDAACPTTAMLRSTVPSDSSMTTRLPGSQVLPSSIERTRDIRDWGSRCW